MKKIIVIIVFITAGFSVTANSLLEDLQPYKVAKTNIVKVSPFCISIAKGDYEIVKK